MLRHPSSKSLNTAWLIVICFAALAIRLATWTIDPHSEEPKEDSRQYHNAAWNLASQGVYSIATEPPYEPYTRRTPGYPLFLAGMYWLRGAPDVHFAKLVQCILGVAACGLTFLITKRVGGSDELGLWSAALVAVFPAVVLYCDRLMSDGLLLLVLTAATYTAYRWADSASSKWAVACGLLWGASAMVKPEAALLPAAVVPAALILTRRRRRLVLQALVAVALTGGIVGSWLYRNRQVTGSAAIEVRDRKAISNKFLRNYRLRAENGFTFAPERFTYLYGSDWKKDQAAFEKAMAGPVKNPAESDLMYFLRRPGTLLKYSGIRFLQLFKPASKSETFGLSDDFSQYKRDGDWGRFSLKLGMLLLDAAVLGVCGVGFLVSLRWRHRRLWIVSATVAYFIAIYSLIHAIGRYRVPLLPLLIILGVWWLGTLATRHSGHPAPDCGSEPEETAAPPVPGNAAGTTASQLVQPT